MGPCRYVILTMMLLLLCIWCSVGVYKAIKTLQFFKTKVLECEKLDKYFLTEREMFLFINEIYLLNY